MRTYKSIERPAQVLGMNLTDLGLVVGLLISSVLVLGVLSMAMHVSKLLYLASFLIVAALFYLLRYLSKHRPPGFLFGWVSFTFIQPRRVSLGVFPPAHEKTKNSRV
jgi:hypothetical protein